MLAFGGGRSKSPTGRLRSRLGFCKEESVSGIECVMKSNTILQTALVVLWNLFVYHAFGGI